MPVGLKLNVEHNLNCFANLNCQVLKTTMMVQNKESILNQRTGSIKNIIQIVKSPKQQVKPVNPPIPVFLQISYIYSCAQFMVDHGRTRMTGKNSKSILQGVVYKKAYDTSRAGRILIQHQPLNIIPKIQIIGCIIIK